MSEDEDRLLIIRGIKSLSKIYLAHPYLCVNCQVKLKALIASCDEYAQVGEANRYQPLLKRFNELFDKIKHDHLPPK